MLNKQKKKKFIKTYLVILFAFYNLYIINFTILSTYIDMTVVYVKINLKQTTNGKTSMYGLP